jgi:TonB family protein
LADNAVKAIEQIPRLTGNIMGKFLQLLFLLTIASVSFAVGQSDGITGNIQVHGKVQDPSGAAITGLSLFVTSGPNNRAFASDRNGNFVLLLQPGVFEVTVNKINSPDFKLILKISESGLNPDDLTLVFDLDRYCCRSAAGEKYPEPAVLPKPPYPAAARAVRAQGEVVVAVKIDNEGKVVSADALGGHPLLVAASLAAARQTRFAAAGTSGGFEAVLVYVFMSGDDEKSDVPRYKNPYRIDVVAAPLTFYTSASY